MFYVKVELPKHGDTVHVVPVGADMKPEQWWKATLLKIDTSNPRGPFLVRTQTEMEDGYAAGQQWVSTIVEGS